MRQPSRLYRRQSLSALTFRPGVKLPSEGLLDPSPEDTREGSEREFSESGLARGAKLSSMMARALSQIWFWISGVSVGGRR